MSIKEFLKPTNKSMFYWFILGMAILIAGGAIWYYSNSIQEPTEKKQATYPLDIVIKSLPAEEAIQFLYKGEVKKITYSEEYKNSISIGHVNFILKDGRNFISGPIPHILSAIERCGGPCNDLEKVLIPKNSILNTCGPEPPAVCAEGARLTCENGKWGCKEIKEKAVFYSQEECEQKTGKSCGFQTCDFIPAGKTFEEVCGKDFKKGWIPKRSVLNQTPLENQKIIGKITFSDIEGGCWGFQGDNGEHFLIGGDDKSEEIKKIPDILSKNVEIQGKIEKDIVSYCPVGDGLFELESYRIISDNATNIFNKFLD